MPKKNKPFLLTTYFIPLLVLGGAIILLSFLLESQRMLFSGMQQIGVGIGLIGIGEWMNHPIHKSLSSENKENGSQLRKRNPSALGNLFVILGLLLFFIGLADFL